MSREAVSKTIGEFEYRIVPLGAKQGTRMATRLGKLVAALAPSPDSTGSVEAKVLDRLRTLFDTLSESDVDYFCDTFAKFTEVQIAPNKWPNLDKIFDEHFAGHYGDLTNWLLACIEVNFGSFLEEMGLELPKELPKAA